MMERRRLLSYDPGGGHTDQLRDLSLAIALAELLDRALVLPSYFHHRDVNVLTPRATVSQIAARRPRSRPSWRWSTNLTIIDEPSVVVAAHEQPRCAANATPDVSSGSSHRSLQAGCRRTHALQGIQPSVGALPLDARRSRGPPRRAEALPAGDLGAAACARAMQHPLPPATTGSGETSPAPSAPQQPRAPSHRACTCTSPRQGQGRVCGRVHPKAAAARRGGGGAPHYIIHCERRP